MVHKRKAKAQVKVLTEMGYWCLWEIKGLKEGTIVEGVFTEETKAFDFFWNGQGVMLWIGQNAILVE